MSKENKYLSPDELADLMIKPSLSGNCVSSQIRFLAGKILTIVDASVQDEKQNKAVKDLIRNEVASTLGLITTLVSNGRELMVSNEEAEKAIETDLSEVIK